jgi:hypothetical protein
MRRPSPRLECDMCEEPATHRVTIEIGRRSLLRNLCRSHLGQLLNGTRPAEGDRSEVYKATPASAARASVTSIHEHRVRQDH